MAAKPATRAALVGCLSGAVTEREWMKQNNPGSGRAAKDGKRAGYSRAQSCFLMRSPSVLRAASISSDHGSPQLMRRQLWYRFFTENRAPGAVLMRCFN